jgi:benzodiazapine receptor
MRLSGPTRLIVSLGICLLPSVSGVLFTTRTTLGEWYANLNKPFFTPPGWLFGPVWTTLYLLMGVSAFLVWQKGIEKRPVKVALAMFLMQLFLNALWTPLFFGLQNPAAAFVEIILLWVAIVVTIVAMGKVSRLAALLLWPYVLWVSFAAVLNGSIWLLNW